MSKKNRNIDKNCDNIIHIRTNSSTIDFDDFIDMDDYPYFDASIFLQ
jgi:hypothetical protein